jgi:hypothetical protein
MKLLYVRIACLLVITGLISCNSGEVEETAEVSTPATPPTFSALKATDSVKPLIASPKQGVFNTGVNPAHGAPGHRCEIAVGAPLNSAPIQVQQPAQMPSPVQANPVISNNPVKPAVSNPSPVTAGTLNPAHGQPGHRCDIAVGAPLNSAPKAASVQPQVPLQTTTPVMQVNPNSSVKLNPAHGQPGHDCSIQVGQPLKQ